MRTAVEHQESDISRRQRLLVVGGAIVLGYVVAFYDAFSEIIFPYSTLEVGAIIVVGLTYTVLLLNEGIIFGKSPTNLRKGIYFLTMLVLLVITYSLMKTVNGVWLIAMPLVGTAVAMLSRLWGWLYALAVLLSMIIPLVALFGADEVPSLVFGLGPAFIFVVVFVSLWINAEEARQKAQTLADELEKANQSLSTYAAQAEELATTKERNRLAREIHDSLGHYLTVINVQIEAARVTMDQNPAKAAGALGKAQKLTQEGLASVRHSVSALRESPLQDRPLAEAIAHLAEETRNAGLVTEFEIKGNGRSLEPATELTLYRAVQEGLTNVRKHARASRVDLTLDYQQANQVRLTIQDNGIGAQETMNGGFGLIGVRERVNILGGEMALKTEPGQGFTLTVMVPA